jgi:hypothetical protein
VKKIKGYLSDGTTRDYYFVEIPETTKGRYIIRAEEVPTNKFIDTIWPLETILLKRQAFKVLFKEPAKFTVLEEKKNRKNYIWTTDYLEEQTSQLDYISHFKGKVLVGGLGIGLVVKYLEENTDVSEIVVVEKEKPIIDLVAPYLNLQKKTKIIHADLYKYLKYCRERFDYAYYDIWQEADENAYVGYMIPLYYLSEGIIKEENIVCWAEDIAKF